MDTKHKARQKRYKDSKKGKETQKAYYEKTKSTRKEYNAKYYRENLERINVIKRRWNVKNREKLNRLSRERSRRIKKEVIEHYGGKCVCCGETEIAFLAIDHVKGGGNKHRKSINGKKMYEWLKMKGLPKKGFQILCHNCNQAKGYYGSCPHQNKSPQVRTVDKASINNI